MLFGGITSAWWCFLHWYSKEKIFFWISKQRFQVSVTYSSRCCARCLVPQTPVESPEQQKRRRKNTESVLTVHVFSYCLYRQAHKIFFIFFCEDSGRFWAFSCYWISSFENRGSEVQGFGCWKCLCVRALLALPVVLLVRTSPNQRVGAFTSGFSFALESCRKLIGVG